MTVVAKEQDVSDNTGLRAQQQIILQLLNVMREGEIHTQNAIVNLT